MRARISEGSDRRGRGHCTFLAPQVADGVWDWSVTDATLEEAAEQGFFIETALIVGNAAPSWIYNRAGGNASVPKVFVGSEKAGTVTYPYYLDPTYEKLFLRALDTFAAHIAAFPVRIKGRIIAAQAMYGSTGDDCPWHCNQTIPGGHGTCEATPAKYEIDDIAWHKWTMSTVKRVCQIYTSRGIRVLWNTNSTYTMEQFAECPGSFMKYGSISHGFQTTDEMDKWSPELCRKGGLHCRGESWPFMAEGYHDEAPLWATYTHLMWQLTWGLDLPGLTTRSLVNQSYTGLYEMFNRYVGPLAWCWADKPAGAVDSQ